MIGGGESTDPQNANDRRAGKADSNYDIRQTMTTTTAMRRTTRTETTTTKKKKPGRSTVKFDGLRG